MRRPYRNSLKEALGEPKISLKADSTAPRRLGRGGLTSHCPVHGKARPRVAAIAMYYPPRLAQDFLIIACWTASIWPL